MLDSVSLWGCSKIEMVNFISYICELNYNVRYNLNKGVAA